MPFWTVFRAAAALLFFAHATGAWSQAVFSDDVNVEPEIVNAGAFQLVPEPAEPNPEQFVPRPHPTSHASQEDAGPAHVILGDIPFNAARTTSEPTANLWERIRNSFGMETLGSPLVKDWENWYASRPDYLARMFERGERYLFYVVEEVEKRGMPSEIALLPMIESAYNPKAYSTSHASGIWQFIPSTGKNYGLRQNWWQDERRDVLAATRAALDYLEKLYAMFGSWELALASYNWGEGAVARAIQRNEARGLSTDYLSLSMPAETRNYVPKLMAIKNLIARPEDFGIALADIENRPYFTVVTTDKHIDVELAAKFAEIATEDFLALNPSHNRPVIRADGTQSILLPADRVETFQANLEAHGDKLTSWQSYKISKGDRLDRVARRFGIELSQLKEVNGIPARLPGMTGLTILVPDNSEQSGGDVAAAGFSAAALSAAASVVMHIVKAGETLSGIARRYRISVAQLASRNGIHNGRIYAGQKLSLMESIVQAAPASKPAVAVKRPTKTRVAGTAKKPGAKPAKQTTNRSGSRTQVAYINRRD